MKTRIIITSALSALLCGSAAHAAIVVVDGLTAQDCTLADALAATNGPDDQVLANCVRMGDLLGVPDPSDTIIFADTVPDVLSVADTLIVTDALEIDGAGRIVLETSLSQRILVIALDPAATVTLSGLTLRGAGAPSKGGGVRVVTGNLQVVGSTFDANTAGYGGAIYVDAGASLEVMDSALTGNQARRTARDSCSPDPVDLGSAGSFVVLAGATVTNTGLSVITGDLGVSPGTAVTGFPPGILDGVMLTASDAAQAKADLQLAYDDAASRDACVATLAGNLGGRTLFPGLYKSTSSLEVSSGDLTLDAQGDTDAVFMFQMESTFIMTSDRKIFLTNGARASNVYWQVGSSATIGTSSVMVGTIMASQSITMENGASLVGRALTNVAAVTLDTNAIVGPDVAAGPGGSEIGGATSGGVEGGAVACFGTCSFERVLFADNVALGGTDGDALGGAISALDATLTLRNTTLSNNRVSAGLAAVDALTAAQGGAIAALGGTVDIAFATIVGNSATRQVGDLLALATGGGLFLMPGATSDYRLYGSVVSGNAALTAASCAIGQLADVESEYNRFDDAMAQSDCEATSLTNAVGDAQLLGLADNGGPTRTVRFMRTSTVFDALPASECVDAGGVDQRGYPRDGLRCDSGALELENLALDVDAPASHYVPAGAVASQSVTVDWVVDVPVPATAVGFVFTVPVDVTATVFDAGGVALAGCITDGLGATSCLLGDLVPSERSGTIELAFAASRQTDIAWEGIIELAFDDAEPLDDVDAGVIAIQYCGDDVVDQVETCDDGGASGGCNALCAGCENGFTGADCLDCVGLDDGNLCTDDVCGPLGAVHTNNALACDDGDACTTGDVCAAGACGGSAAVIDDGNVCTDDSCDPAVGVVHTNNTVPCDDGSVCTTGDVCGGGVCGAAVVVDDGNVCTDDSCDAVLGVVHTNNVAPCDDDDVCTSGDVCGAGACGGEALDVDDGDACTFDSCDPVTGEQHTADPSCEEPEPRMPGLVERGGGGCGGSGMDLSLLGLLAAALVMVRRRARVLAPVRHG